MYNLFLDNEGEKKENPKKRLNILLERKKTVYKGNNSFEVPNEVLKEVEEKPKLIFKNKNNHGKGLFNSK